MNSVQKAISGTTLINTMMMHYLDSGDKLSKSGDIILKRCRRFMRKRSKINSEFRDTVLLSDEAWKKTVNYFSDKNIKIEVKSTILSIFEYFEDDLKKHAEVSAKIMEKFMSTGLTDDAEAEHNSSLVVDYLVQQIGLDKKTNPFAGKKLTIKNNLILERKTLDKRFA